MTTSVIINLVVLIFLVSIIYFAFTFFVNKPMNSLIEKFKLAGEGDLKQEIVHKIPSLNCSKLLGCGQEDCSCFDKDGRCWETAGSFSAQVECPKILTGEYQSCVECKAVFHKARLDELQMLSSFFNGFIFSIRNLISDMTSSMGRMSSSSEAMSSAATEMQDAVGRASEDAKKKSLIQQQQ